MISNNFLYKHIMPTMYKLKMVEQDEPIIFSIKAAASLGVDYLLVMKGDNPLGIISINAMLKELDKLSQYSLNDFVDKDFILIDVSQLEQLTFKDLSNRYILIQKDKEYISVMDLESTPYYYNQLIDGTLSIMNSLLDSLYNGIIAVDEEKNIIVINQSAADIYGVSKEYAIDKPLSVAMPLSPLNNYVFASEPSVFNKCEFNNLVIQANRTLMSINGRFVGGISVFQDITNSEELNKELVLVKKNEEYLESVIANSYDGIYITDRDGLTLNANQSYVRITGIEKHQLIGKYMKDLVEEGLLSESITTNVVSQKKPITQTQTIKNGKKVIITGSPIFDDAGEVIKVITNVRDISELISLEKKLNILNEMTNMYQKELFKDIGKENIVCQSEKFTSTMNLAKRVSSKDSTVLILGETGVGKEIVAKYVHMCSKRKNNHYVKINCGSIPANLLESELFGYSPGAFTGANTKGKVGLFELANEGTLFLDEIGELPIDLQSSLLRVLQDGEVIRVGDTKVRKVDVRILAATNRNLEEMISKGTFRKDLYYRLNVVSIYVPSLRERLDDIPILAEHFIALLNEKYKENKVITSNFISQLLTLDWPGNVREMSNFIEKQFVMSDEDIIDSFISTPHSTVSTWGNNSSAVDIKGILPLDEALKEVESILLDRAMRIGKTTYKAAELLKMSQSTFFRKYKEYHNEDIQRKGDQDNKF